MDSFHQGYEALSLTARLRRAGTGPPTEIGISRINHDPSNGAVLRYPLGLSTDGVPETAKTKNLKEDALRLTGIGARDIYADDAYFVPEYSDLKRDDAEVLYPSPSSKGHDQLSSESVTCDACTRDYRLGVECTHLRRAILDRPSISPHSFNGFTSTSSPKIPLPGACERRRAQIHDYNVNALKAVELAMSKTKDSLLIGNEYYLDHSQLSTNPDQSNQGCHLLPRNQNIETLALNYRFNPSPDVRIHNSLGVYDCADYGVVSMPNTDGTTSQSKYGMAEATVANILARIIAENTFLALKRVMRGWADCEREAKAVTEGMKAEKYTHIRKVQVDEVCGLQIGLIEVTPLNHLRGYRHHLVDHSIQRSGSCTDLLQRAIHGLEHETKRAAFLRRIKTLEEEVESLRRLLYPLDPKHPLLPEAWRTAYQAKMRKLSGEGEQGKEENKKEESKNEMKRDEGKRNLIGPPALKPGRVPTSAGKPPKPPAKGGSKPQVGPTPRPVPPGKRPPAVAPKAPKDDPLDRHYIAKLLSAASTALNNEITAHKAFEPADYETHNYYTQDVPWSLNSGPQIGFGSDVITSVKNDVRLCGARLTALSERAPFGQKTSSKWTKAPLEVIEQLFLPVNSLHDYRMALKLGTTARTKLIAPWQGNVYLYPMILTFRIKWVRRVFWVTKPLVEALKNNPLTASLLNAVNTPRSSSPINPPRSPLLRNRTTSTPTTGKSTPTPRPVVRGGVLRPTPSRPIRPSLATPLPPRKPATPSPSLHVSGLNAIGKEGAISKGQVKGDTSLVLSLPQPYIATVSRPELSMSASAHNHYMPDGEYVPYTRPEDTDYKTYPSEFHCASDADKDGDRYWTGPPTSYNMYTSGDVERKCNVKDKGMSVIYSSIASSSTYLSQDTWGVCGDICSHLAGDDNSLTPRIRRNPFPNEKKKDNDPKIDNSVARLSLPSRSDYVLLTTSDIDKATGDDIEQLRRITEKSSSGPSYYCPSGFSPYTREETSSLRALHARRRRRSVGSWGDLCADAALLRLGHGTMTTNTGEEKDATSADVPDEESKHTQRMSAWRSNHYDYINTPHEFGGAFTKQEREYLSAVYGAPEHLGTKSIPEYTGTRAFHIHLVSVPELSPVVSVLKGIRTWDPIASQHFTNATRKKVTVYTPTFLSLVLYNHSRRLYRKRSPSAISNSLAPSQFHFDDADFPPPLSAVCPRPDKCDIDDCYLGLWDQLLAKLDAADTFSRDQFSYHTLASYRSTPPTTAFPSTCFSLTKSSPLGFIPIPSPFCPFPYPFCPSFRDQLLRTPTLSHFSPPVEHAIFGTLPTRYVVDIDPHQSSARRYLHLFSKGFDHGWNTVDASFHPHYISHPLSLVSHAHFFSQRRTPSASPVTAMLLGCTSHLIDWHQESTNHRISYSNFTSSLTTSSSSSSSYSSSSSSTSSSSSSSSSSTEELVGNFSTHPFALHYYRINTLKALITQELDRGLPSWYYHHQLRTISSMGQGADYILRLIPELVTRMIVANHFPTILPSALFNLPPSSAQLNRKARLNTCSFTQAYQAYYDTFPPSNLNGNGTDENGIRYIRTDPSCITIADILVRIPLVVALILPCVVEDIDAAEVSKHLSLLRQVNSLAANSIDLIVSKRNATCSDPSVEHKSNIDTVTLAMARYLPVLTQSVIYASRLMNTTLTTSVMKLNGVGPLNPSLASAIESDDVDASPRSLHRLLIGSSPELTECSCNCTSLKKRVLINPFCTDNPQSSLLSLLVMSKELEEAVERQIQQIRSLKLWLSKEQRSDRSRRPSVASMDSQESKADSTRATILIVDLFGASTSSSDSLLLDRPNSRSRSSRTDQVSSTTIPLERFPRPSPLLRLPFDLNHDGHESKYEDESNYDDYKNKRGDPRWWVTHGSPYLSMHDLNILTVQQLSVINDRMDGTMEQKSNASMNSSSNDNIGIDSSDDPTTPPSSSSSSLQPPSPSRPSSASSSPLPSPSSNCLVSLLPKSSQYDRDCEASGAHSCVSGGAFAPDLLTVLIFLELWWQLNDTSASHLNSIRKKFSGDKGLHSTAETALLQKSHLEMAYRDLHNAGVQSRPTPESLRLAFATCSGSAYISDLHPTIERQYGAELPGSGQDLYGSGSKRVAGSSITDMNWATAAMTALEQISVPVDQFKTLTEQPRVNY